MGGPAGGGVAPNGGRHCGLRRASDKPVGSLAAPGSRKKLKRSSVLKLRQNKDLQWHADARKWGIRCQFGAASSSAGGSPFGSADWPFEGWSAGASADG